MKNRVRRYTSMVHTYYVDNTLGSDSNTGQADKPLKTIAAVNALLLRPGDRVLFKRGETWKTGSLTMSYGGTQEKPIYFGAYGNGANPIIDPTTRFTDFALYSGAVWSRSDTNNVKQVFQDDVRLIYATSPVGLVAGAFAKVAGTPGTLYVRCTDDSNPNTNHIIDLCIPANDIAIKLNGKSNLVFENIDVKKTNIAAFVTTAVGSKNIVIKNLTVSYSGIRSIVIGTDGGAGYTYPSNILIYNVIGHNDLDLSFWIGHGTNLVVENCETYRSGADVIPYGKLYPNSGVDRHYPDGILISGESINCIVRGSYIHDIYAGSAIMDELSLGLKGTNSIIERNRIDTSATNVAAIQCEGINTTIRNNWINSGSGSAIIFTNAPAGAKVYNNTLISPSGAGHSIDTTNQVLTCDIKNNIIIRAGSSNRYLSVAVNSKPGFTANRNLFYGASTGRWFWGPNEYTTLATWRTGSSQDANSLNVDPVFVTNYTNLHLQVTSSCIGAGDTSLGILQDYDQVSRGGSVDIGAYEYV